MLPSAKTASSTLVRSASSVISLSLAVPLNTTYFLESLIFTNSHPSGSLSVTFIGFVY